MQLDRALLTFEWRFDSLSTQRTRMTQRIELSGENEAAYAEQVEVGFRPGLAGGCGIEGSQRKWLLPESGVQ